MVRDHAWVWVTEFPLFVEDEGTLAPSHHPFVLPVAEDVARIEGDPASVRSLAYDLVYNGTELGSGSLRIHEAGLQQRVLRRLGMTDEEIDRKFGFLLEALGSGAPPHGGIALGMDRIVKDFVGGGEPEGRDRVSEDHRGTRSLRGRARAGESVGAHGPRPGGPRRAVQVTTRSEMASTENTITEHRLDAGGADHLMLAGVNDANLQELARVFGIRVVLRGDEVTLSGEVPRLERAVPVMQHLIELARLRAPFDSLDVSRLAEEFDRKGADAQVLIRQPELRIALPGIRKVITPKSQGQAKYLETIYEHDIVIGIGPAGTGKDVPCRGRGRGSALPKAGQAHHPGASGGRGRREPRFPSRRHAGEGRSVPPAPVRCT